MEPNVPLLRKMVEWVEEQDALPEEKEWYQGTWFFTKFHPEEAEWCDSAMCVAGKVAVDDGWVPRVVPPHFTGEVIKGEKRENVWVVAAWLLGLEMEVADVLFNGDNEAHDIRRIAEEIAGERL